MTMLHQLLLPELREAVEDGDFDSLKSFCEVLHPQIVAEMLYELGDIDLFRRLFKHVDTPNRARLFEYLPDEVQDELADTLPVDEIANLIERMSHDERVDLVRRMDDERQAEVMPLVARAEREDIVRLLNYPEGTAGSVMTTDYASLPADVNVEEAIRRLGREAPDRETIYYVYVVDADRRLIGFVELKDLIRSPRWKKVSEIMREDVIRISAKLNVEEAAAQIAQYDVLAIPVVDDEGRLVGIITHDDVVDILIEAATEDAHLMGAVQPIRAGYLDSGFVEVVRKRIPWLVVLFGAELIASGVLQRFEHLLEIVILVFLLPVVIATGGNSGSQAATLVTRALALGDLELRDWWKVALREIVQGVSLGLMIGSLSIVPVWIMSGSDAVVRISPVIFCSLIAVITTGSLVGSQLPFLFLRLGMDPAYSSGPFVASMVDVVGIFIYMSIAAAMLSVSA